MRARVGTVVLICAFAVGALAVGLNARAQSRARRPGPPPSTRPAGGLEPTRLQIDIFELSCTTDQLASLSLDQIGGDGASVEQVLGRLTALGQARVFARMDDVIALPGEAKLTTGHRAPVVQDIVLSKGGVAAPSVSYQEVGTVAEISGRWLDNEESDQAQLQLSVEFSGIGRSHVQLSSDVKLPVFVECNVEKSLLARSGQPVLTLTNLIPDASDAEKRVTAYVVRTVVTRVSP